MNGNPALFCRPDTYIGSPNPVTEKMYVLDSGSSRIVQREITYSPGLFKIFDEILVNAADNKVPHGRAARMLGGGRKKAFFAIIFFPATCGKFYLFLVGGVHFE